MLVIKPKQRESAPTKRRYFYFTCESNYQLKKTRTLIKYVVSLVQKHKKESEAARVTRRTCGAQHRNVSSHKMQSILPLTMR